MKTTRNLIVTGMLAAFCCSVASAQIIYSNSFNGAHVDINGTAPTYINPSAASFGGSLGAAFDVVSNNAAGGYAAYQDGTLDAKLNSVLLPFTPQPGYVYTLDFSLTFQTVPPAGGWGMIGFTKNMPASNTGGIDPRMGALGGNPTALLNMYANGGGAILNAPGAIGKVPNLMTATGTPYDIKLELDTTAAQWSTALYVAGTFVTNYVYGVGSNPTTISACGYSQTTTAAGAFKWNSMTLSAVPEPSALALVGAGLAVMFFVTRYRRRRYAAGKIVMQ